MVYKFSQNIQRHQVFINIIFLKAFLQTILPNYPSLNWLPSILAAQLSSPITLHLHPGDSSCLFLRLDPISYTPRLPDSFWWSISSSKVYFLVCFPQPNGPLWATTFWVSKQTKISVLLCALVCRLPRSSSQFSSSWELAGTFFTFTLFYRQQPVMKRPGSGVKQLKVQILALTLIPFIDSR